MEGILGCGLRRCLVLEPGGAKGDRTPDLGIANAALSQLSYRPFSGGFHRPDWLLVPVPDSVKLACGGRYAYIYTDQKPKGCFPMMSMNPFLWLILTVIDIYFWIILAMVVLSWLVAFNVVNRSNPYVRQFGQALEKLTEPLLRPIRRFLPDLGGIDISPIVLLIAMQFLGMLITRLFVNLGWA